MKQGLQLKNDLNTDFKVTAKVAELIEEGAFETDQIAVLPAGPKKRAYAKEIGTHSFYYSESKRKECLNIEIHQEGLYDMLPEGLFHNPPTGSSGMSEQQMIEDVQYRREEEKDARKFFMPFEAELNYLKTIMELYENRLDKKTTYADLTRIFNTGWKEFELLNKEQSILWMHFLPVIHQKRNDIRFLEKFLSLLFKIPVNIEFNTQTRPTPIANELQFKLGSGALGISTTIGDHFLNEAEEIHIHIGPSSTEKLLDFMPDTQHTYILDLAVSYIIPVDYDVKVNLIADRSHQIGSLGAESSNSLLGYTVYL